MFVQSGPSGRRGSRNPDRGEEEGVPARTGPRPPREEVEPDPLQDDPRVDRRLLDRLLQVQPSRADITQGQRRMQLERCLDWLDAIAVTVSRAGYRIEWRMSPMPVRWRPDDRGTPFALENYLTSHSWVPLGQVYGSPAPTDRPLPNPDMVYPPYSADQQYVAWVARTIRTWARFHESAERLQRRRERYAERRRRQRESTETGEVHVCCGFQEDWELVSVPARCLRWVNRNNPPSEPIVLTPEEGIPQHLHPCGIWGDLLESPTQREEVRPHSPPRWPPREVEDLGDVPERDVVFPGVRAPALRERRRVHVLADRPASPAPLETTTDLVPPVRPSTPPAATPQLYEIRPVPTSLEVVDTEGAQPSSLPMEGLGMPIPHVVSPPRPPPGTVSPSPDRPTRKRTRLRLSAGEAPSRKPAAEPYTRFVGPAAAETPTGSPVPTVQLEFGPAVAGPPGTPSVPTPSRELVGLLLDATPSPPPGTSPKEVPRPSSKLFLAKSVYFCRCPFVYLRLSLLCASLS